MFYAYYCALQDGFRRNGIPIIMQPAGRAVENCCQLYYSKLLSTEVS